MKDKAKKIMFEKVPIGVVSVILTFVLFNLLATPAMVELIKLQCITCAS